jgi:hypothetical protein
MSPEAVIFDRMREFAATPGWTEVPMIRLVTSALAERVEERLIEAISLPVPQAQITSSFICWAPAPIEVFRRLLVGSKLRFRIS